MAWIANDLVKKERTLNTCVQASRLGYHLRVNETSRGTQYTFLAPDGTPSVGRRFPNPQDALADACSQLRSDHPELAD